jgi:hypothetical protein
VRSYGAYFRYHQARPGAYEFAIKRAAVREHDFGNGPPVAVHVADADRDELAERLALFGAIQHRPGGSEPRVRSPVTSSTWKGKYVRKRSRLGEKLLQSTRSG